MHAIDAAGNISPDATRAYTLDRTVPPAPSITLGARRRPATCVRLAWEFSGTGAARYECRLQRPDGSDVAGWQVCTTGWGQTLAAGEPDGDYVFSVRGENAAGSDGPEETSTYRLDTAAPAPPDITATPASPAADATPTWAFAGEAGATAAVPPQTWRDRCRRLGGVHGGTMNFNLSSATDGTYDFEVRATDAAGNIGNPATGSFSSTASPPATPTIDVAPPAKGADRTPPWSFTGTARAHECRLSAGRQRGHRLGALHRSDVTHDLAAPPTPSTCSPCAA